MNYNMCDWYNHLSSSSMLMQGLLTPTMAQSKRNNESRPMPLNTWLSLGVLLYFKDLPLSDDYN